MWLRIRPRCATLLGKNIAVAFSNSRSPSEYEFATDRSKETSASEPLMTCRKVQSCRQNRVSFVNRGEVWEIACLLPRWRLA